MQAEYIWALKIITRDQQRKKQIYPEMEILKKGRWSQQKPRKIITVIINVSGQGSPLEILLAIKNFSRVDFSFCEMCHCRWCLHYLHRWSWPARGLPLEPPTTPLLRSATPASKAWSWVFLSRILFILALPFPFGLVWTLCKLFWERVALLRMLVTYHLGWCIHFLTLKRSWEPRIIWRPLLALDSREGRKQQDLIEMRSSP